MERKGYDQLQGKIKVEGFGKVDHYILVLFESLLLSGREVDECVVSVLIEVKGNSEIDFEKYGQLIVRVKDIISLWINPTQLIGLMDLEDVLSIEASGRATGMMDSCEMML